MVIEGIKELRKALKLTGVELGKRLGKSKAAVCDIEKGRTVNLKVISKYAKECGYDEIELVFKSSTLERKKRVVLKLINEEEQENV